MQCPFCNGSVQQISPEKYRCNNCGNKLYYSEVFSVKKPEVFSPEEPESVRSPIQKKTKSWNVGNPIFPDVSTPEGAKRAVLYGVFASVIMILICLYCSFNLNIFFTRTNTHGFFRSLPIPIFNLLAVVYGFVAILIMMRFQLVVWFSFMFHYLSYKLLIYSSYGYSDSKFIIFIYGETEGFILLFNFILVAGLVCYYNSLRGIKGQNWPFIPIPYI